MAGLSDRGRRPGAPERFERHSSEGSVRRPRCFQRACASQTDELGQPYPLDDAEAVTLAPSAKRAADGDAAGCRGFLETVFGRGIAEWHELVDAVQAANEHIKKSGLRAALRAEVVDANENPLPRNLSKLSRSDSGLPPRGPSFSRSDSALFVENFMQNFDGDFGDRSDSLLSNPSQNFF